MLKLNYSKTTLIGALFLSLIILVSACSTEEPFESLAVTDGPEDSRGTPPPLPGYILAQLVPDGPCINLHDGFLGTKYNIRATSGTYTHTYDRMVHIVVMDDQASGIPGVDTMVASGTVTIPANQTQSEPLRVFNNATMNYGDVEVRILSVTTGSGTDRTDYFELRSTSPTINNCYISNSGGPGLDPGLGL